MHLKENVRSRREIFITGLTILSFLLLCISVPILIGYIAYGDLAPKTHLVFKISLGAFSVGLCFCVFIWIRSGTENDADSEKSDPEEDTIIDKV